MLKKNLKTRASIQNVTKAIKSTGAPRQITQQPFDYDPSHYRRLCDLGSNPPNASDLCDYALDMKYTELQPDLLRYLTPVLLEAWRRDLFEGDEGGYGAFVEEFWPALLKGKALHEVYSETERQAFTAYLRNTILDRMDIEDSLHFAGNKGTTSYRWIETLVSYGTLFSGVDILWNEWWRMETPGHAICAFQYVSALMYEDDKNPVFEAWTPKKGGGPPAVWACCGMMFDVGWGKENLDFLKGTLNAHYIEEKLQLAFEQIQSESAQKIASGIISDFAGQRARLELRIEQLLNLLKDVSQTDGFTI
jgi:hypothetical protein